MTLFYEPQNQPGSELVKRDSLFWSATEQFLELIDCEVNTERPVMERLSLVEMVHMIPPASVDPRVIVVDGPIGAGKTTFCHMLVDYAAHFGMKVALIEEVIGLINFNVYGITLEEYYQDPKANAYRFQLAVVRALGDQLLEFRYSDRYQNYDLIIFDRWLPSTSAFILFQMEERHITPRQGMYLHYLIDAYMSYAGVLPGTHIRFATDPLVCEQRIIARAVEDSHRKCEGDALLTIRRTNEHLLEQRGIYCPLFNLNYPPPLIETRFITEGNQYALSQAVHATRQYVIQETLYLGDDRHYFILINNRKVNCCHFFAELCDWAFSWKSDHTRRNICNTLLSFEQFKRALEYPCGEHPTDNSDE